MPPRELNAAVLSIPVQPEHNWPALRQLPKVRVPDLRSWAAITMISRAIGVQTGLPARRGVSPAVLLYSALFILMCLSYGGVGKELFHNTIHTGDPEDPNAKYWNFARYFVIVSAFTIACLGGPNSLFRSIRTERYLLPYGLLTVASYGWTDDPTSTFRSMILLNGLLFAAAVFAGKLGARRTLNLLMHFLAAVVIVSAALAILVPTVGRHDASDALFLSLVGKWRGVFGHKNTLGQYGCYTVVLLFIFGDLMPAPRPYIWAARLCAALCLAMAASSNAIVGAVAMMGTYVLFSRREFMNPLVMAGGAISGLLVVTLGSTSLVADLLGRDESFSGRTLIWEVGFQVWQQSPLLGYGYVGSGVVTGPVLMATLFDAAVDVHNGYLETLLDTGIVGLALLLFGLLGSVVKAFQALLHARGVERRILLAMTMLVIGGLAMAFGEIAPFRVVSDGYLTYLGALVVTALSDLRRYAPQPRPAPPSSDRATFVSRRGRTPRGLTS